MTNFLVIPQMAKLECELKEFKTKWASTKCDLQDSEEKLRETEAERLKTLSVLKGALENLDNERKKINELERIISLSSNSGTSKDTAKNVSF